MGIQGLLPLLKSIMVPIHIKELEGCCVAVDTYSWLHKGALSCSTQLCKGEPTSRHIDYCMHRVNLLRHYGVKPVLVFDGGLLPMKGEQENKRARARKENMARGIEHETNGNSTAAYECYQKAVDISPSIAYELIKVLKQENVYYVVAPYEADAQMTFLAVSKQVEAVITEDSDLIPFGCPRIIFKMDKFGQGVEFRNSMLQQNKDLSFMGFSMQMILEMCILSGCDYLPSIPGMGLKKAHTLIKKFNSYDKVIKHLRYSIATVPPLYEESFKKAIWTFKHQRVYDPINQDIVYLSDPPDNVGDDLDFLGPSIPQHIAKGIAIGDLDPFTKLPFQGENVSARPVLDGTYQLKSLKSGIKKLDLPAQKNLMTNYFCFASLEAKRKFRAPRTTPNHLNPIVGLSPSPEEYVTDEVAACKIDCSKKSLSDSQNLGIVHHKESVEDGVFPTEFLESPSHGGSDDVKGTVGDTRNPEHVLLHQSSRSIHKPWLSLHKERGCKDTSVAAEGQTKIEKRKIVVRSSYFQNKVNKENDYSSKNEAIFKENDYSSKNEALLVKDDVAVIACEKDNGVTPKSTEFLESPSHGLDDLKDMVGDTRNPEDALLQQSIHLSHNPSLALLKERECKDASAAVEGKTVIEKRKVTVRSCYFQRKEVKEKGCDSTNVLSVKDGVFTDTRENTIPESHFGEGYFRDTLMKRKVSPVDDVQTENVNPKYKRANVSITNKSNLASNLDETFVGAETDEEKFGCNISHLNQYTKIAEKSMERFVSVISSFRCSSSKSGSRASGLRAPLKDVCNTRTNRSTVSMDLSKFAYVPKNGKSSLASRRV